MHRTASTADISEYKINEGAIKLLSVSDLILLIASLVMVATGKSIYFFFILYFGICLVKNRQESGVFVYSCVLTYLLLLI